MQPSEVALGGGANYSKSNNIIVPPILEETLIKSIIIATR